MPRPGRIGPFVLPFLALAFLLGFGWWALSNHRFVRGAETEMQRRLQFSPRVVSRVEVTNSTSRQIVRAAHAQIGDVYDASYQTLAYPGGDVQKGRGACTDVVIRALRGAGFDLQRLVHEDMRRHFGAYPKNWGLRRPNASIDHRRVPNLMVFFERRGQPLPLETTGEALETWQPGDIVCWRLPDGRWHTGVVSDGIGESGKPMVIHNGWRCAEQDYLDAWKIVGHYRFPAS